MRSVTRAIIFTITVLISYLITGAIEDRIFTEAERFRPITATLLGMGIVVIIFVPVFAYTEKLTEAVIKAALRQTKSSAGRIFGIILFVIVLFAILFSLFLDRWFNISVLDAI